MKKLFLSVAVLAAIAAASCGTSEKKALDEGAAIKARIENCSDPDSLNIYVKQAQDYAESLKAKGDDAAAQAYIEEVAPVIEAKDPSSAGVFEKFGEKADKVVSTVGDSVASKASAATEATKEAIETAKEKTGQVVDAAKEKTADAIQGAADATKGVLGK